MTQPVARPRREAFAKASRFRGEFYAYLTARRDELFELCDTVLCADGPMKSLVGVPRWWGRAALSPVYASDSLTPEVATEADL